MTLFDLPNMTRQEFERLLGDLASDDQTTQNGARVTLERLCYLKWRPRIPIGHHLDAQAAHIQDSVAMTCLLAALRHGHPRAREFAAQILGMTRNEVAVPPLIDALTANEPEVRLASPTNPPRNH